MPKTNDQSGATYAGTEGIVEHGATLNNGSKFSQVDPERDLAGNAIPGEHPDREDLPTAATDLTPINPVGDEHAGETAEQRAEREQREAADELSREQNEDEKSVKGGEDVSAGTSSVASQPKTETSNSKSAKTR